MANWTYGSEIEAADWDTRVRLPEGSTLDMLDYTIANSNGLANDPKKEINVFGGEVNVKPTKSPREAVEEMMRVYSAMGDYSLNYTCNLHIHVQVPGLVEDLESMKKIVDYIYHHQEEVFEDILPDIPLPIGDSKSEKLRYRQRQKSHRHRISKTIHEEKMSANSVDEFEMAHKPYKNGSFAAATAIRPGVNTNSLFKHGTIEFRCFPGCDDEEILLECFTWCRNFIKAALGDLPVPTIKRFPEFKPFDEDIDKVFKSTHFDKNSRKQILNYYEENGYENFSGMPR